MGFLKAECPNSLCVHFKDPSLVELKTVPPSLPVLAENSDLSLELGERMDWLPKVGDKVRRKEDGGIFTVECINEEAVEFSNHWGPFWPISLLYFRSQFEPVAVKEKPKEPWLVVSEDKIRRKIDREICTVTFVDSEGVGFRDRRDPFYVSLDVFERLFEPV